EWVPWLLKASRELGTFQSRLTFVALDLVLSNLNNSISSILILITTCKRFSGQQCPAFMHQGPASTMYSRVSSSILPELKIPTVVQCRCSFSQKRLTLSAAG